MDEQRTDDRRHEDAARWRDNLRIGACRGLFELATRSSKLAIYGLVSAHAPLSLSWRASFWGWLIALLSYDFLYYLAHRSHHRWGFFWATHAVHHQAQQMDLSLGLRAGLLNSLIHLPFFLPLALLGIPDDMFLVVSLTHLAAMAWLHTERIGTLGWLEGIINTPSLHRVHHSSDPRDHDRNFGGILIIYDRLFGTYAAPREQVQRYGVHGQEAVRGVIDAHLTPLFAWWRTTRLGKKRDLATG